MSRIPPERLLKPSSATDGDNLYGVCRERGSHRMSTGYYKEGLYPLAGGVESAEMCRDCPRIETKERGIFERPDFRPFA